MTKSKLDHALRHAQQLAASKPPPTTRSPRARKPAREQYSEPQIRLAFWALEQLGQVADGWHRGESASELFERMQQLLVDLGMAHGRDWRPPAPPKAWPQKPLADDLARQLNIRREFAKIRRAFEKQRRERSGHD